MTKTSRAVPREVLARSAGLLEDLCATSSASGDRDGLYSVAGRLADELRARGMVPEIGAEAGLNGAGQPVLVARGPEDGDGRVLLLGHLDTVLPAEPPRIDGLKLHGTGALDMKGGFAALVGSLSLLESRGEPLPSDLVVVAVPDEEVGGPISVRAVRHWGDGARAVRPGGHVVLSGLLGEQMREVVGAYAMAGFTLTLRHVNHNWATLVLRRRSRRAGSGKRNGRQIHAGRLQTRVHLPDWAYDQ